MAAPWRLWLLAGLLAGSASAQLPSSTTVDAAVAAAQPTARALGLELHAGGLWLTLLQRRVPLLAARDGHRCLIGYTSYLPGRDFSWLFPPMPPERAEAWLQGLIHHELAHCAAAGPEPDTTPNAAAGHRSSGQSWRDEARADLGFAVFVDSIDLKVGAELIDRLASLRARHAAVDPEHATAEVLRCYLQDPQRATLRAHAPGDWLQTLNSWAQRCIAR